MSGRSWLRDPAALKDNGVIVLIGAAFAAMLLLVGTPWWAVGLIIVGFVVVVFAAVLLGFLAMRLLEMRPRDPAATAEISKSRAALRERVEEHGPDHALTLTARGEFAGALLAGRAWRKAEIEFRALAEARTRVLGESHAETAESRLGLAEALLGRDRDRPFRGRPRQEAEEELRAVLDIRRRELAESHPDTLAVRRRLAEMLFDWDGRRAEAEAEYREIYARCRAAHGADHPDTLAARCALAVKMADVQKGEAELRAVVDSRVRLLGPDHEDTLETRRLLADLLERMEYTPEAMAEYRLVLAGRTRVLGAYHPSTLQAEDDVDRLRFEGRARRFQH